MERKIVLNRIKCPDGTILTSYHRHDYKEHTDKDGNWSMCDGGISYLRRGGVYEEMSVYNDAPFEVIRESFHWGTRGKNGDRSLKWKLLKDLDSEHIKAILSTKPIDRLRRLFERELKYRNETVKGKT